MTSCEGTNKELETKERNIITTKVSAANKTAKREKTGTLGKRVKGVRGKSNEKSGGEPAGRGRPRTRGGSVLKVKSGEWDPNGNKEGR